MVDPRWRLDGQGALVTGGSAGIGFAVARELLGLGADVMLTARDGDALRTAEDELAEQIAHDGRHARTEEIAEGQIDILDRHDDRDASKTVRAQAPAHHETLEHDHNDLREHALTGHNCVAAHEFWNRL